MRTFAYCAKQFERATRRAAGVQPVTCPPTTSVSFNPIWLRGYDLLYFDLHGMEGGSQWYGDNHIVALTAQQIRRVPLGGSIAFAINCHLADQGSPMLDALLDAGALYVIGGEGPNYGGARTVNNASLLGMLFRLSLAAGIKPLRALALAKWVVRVERIKNKLVGARRQVEASDDTLKFRAYYRQREAGQSRV